MKRSNANKVYIVVRVTEDTEFNDVSVFQSVHSTLEKANTSKQSQEEMFRQYGMKFDILERVIDSSWMSIN